MKKASFRLLLRSMIHGGCLLVVLLASVLQMNKYTRMLIDNDPTTPIPEDPNESAKRLLVLLFCLLVVGLEATLYWTGRERPERVVPALIAGLAVVTAAVKLL